MERKKIATGIDMFIVNLIVIPTGFLVLRNQFNDFDSMARALNLIIIVSMLMFILKDSIGGISIGKRLLGLRVVYERDQNQYVSKWSHVLRNLSYLIWPIDLIMIISSNSKKRLIDRYLGVDVVKEEAIKTKKLIILGASFMLLFVCFIGYSVTLLFSSQNIVVEIATQTIINDENIIKATGGIESVGRIIEGSMQLDSSKGIADYYFNVEGKSKDIVVRIEMKKESNGEWEVIEVEESK